MCSSRVLSMVAAAAVAAAALSACTIPPRSGDANTGPGKTITQIVVVPPESTTPLVPAAPPAAAGQGPLAGFDALAAQLGGDTGIALAPVGGGQSIVAGTLQTGPAWSTIKVPLAIAALTAPGGSGQLTSAAQAVTASDNAAADQLWDSLGAPPVAATQVQAVLQSFGDPATVVESRKTRPEYSAFGQTVWSLAAQTQFASFLPCHTEAAQVLGYMDDIAGDQRWGLGTLPNTSFKGGWGPDEQGRYLARQFGIISTGSGQLAVAIAAEAPSGSFNDATAMLTQIAQWISTRVATVTSGASC
ncbi:hypothetical protein ACFTZB_01115 [Rhodococcus sp. NPDC057014]|uniref:hypothetical protein n=1 Tax=Rhodococcus sp. NPDC057014 TaxID=3346000 RepID=UPI003635F12D